MATQTLGMKRYCRGSSFFSSVKISTYKTNPSLSTVLLDFFCLNSHQRTLIQPRLEYKMKAALSAGFVKCLIGRSFVLMLSSFFFSSPPSKIFSLSAHLLPACSSVSTSTSFHVLSTFSSLFLITCSFFSPS